MIRNAALIMFLTVFCMNVYAQKQDKKSGEQNAGKQTQAVRTSQNRQSLPSISAQSQYTDTFRIRNVNFTKDVDYMGRGEILEVQYTLCNMTDEPLDLYMFVIATYEKTEEAKSSFEMPIPEKERLRSIVPFPDDIKNFQYEDPDNHKIKFLKLPKNPKAGTNPDTGKPYHLVDRLNIWTHHLSKYRNNYFFFNEVAILIFNTEGTLLYKQMYEISGVRH
ncbi:MAG: hypothetical protein JW864_16600 [Spirochaetes bacterium]|nr:hypothetical protein [Spirochaetota bacterium]